MLEDNSEVVDGATTNAQLCTDETMYLNVD